MRSAELAKRLGPLRDRLGDFAGDVRVVGGAVRDALLGLPFRGDVDLATHSDAPVLVEGWYVAGCVDEPPVVFARFGTAKTRIGGLRVEVAQTRTESYAEDSRKPEVMAADWPDDAARRDFTVNALAATLDGVVIDELGRGITDLEQQVLDTPTDPTVTFSDDPLRILRAIRFRHRLGFRYADRVWEAMQSNASRAAILSAERIRDELQGIISHESAASAMQDVVDCGLAAWILPELPAMRGVTQGSMHHLDVWDHSRLVLDHTISADPGASVALRWAALLHDAAKPATRSIDEAGRIRFFDHEVLGAEMAAKILRRLRFSDRDVDSVYQLVRHHMRIGSTTRWSDAALRRLIRDLGDQLPELIALTAADSSALAPGVKRLDLDAFRTRLHDLQTRESVAKYESPLSGEAIMAIVGIPAGPEVGRWKQRLLTAVLDGALAPDDTVGAEAFLRKKMRVAKPPVVPGGD
ncbi:MAG: HD domain-containing protein [Fimbriimonadaceae bacterium]|nr:HD domain-containing protein [Fimbriimonadaceae bacterium]